MGAPQYEQAGADIGGTGTTGTIPVWTGPSTLGNSPLTASGNDVSGAGAVAATGSTATAVAFARAGSPTNGVYFPSTSTVAVSAGGTVAATFGSTAGNGVTLGGTTGLIVNASGTQQGVKLPASPGNSDTQTLDCYQEGTWTPTLTGFGGTAPTVSTARYTRIGRLVTLQVKLSATGGASFSSIAGSTYMTLPSGMTAAVEAPGSTSSSGIAADGPCVAYTTGLFFLPTFALRTSDTFLNVTYTV